MGCVGSGDWLAVTQNLKVLSFSSRFSSVNQALLGGAKLDDLVFGPVMYNVPDDYEII